MSLGFHEDAKVNFYCRDNNCCKLQGELSQQNWSNYWCNLWDDPSNQEISLLSQ